MRKQPTMTVLGLLGMLAMMSVLSACHTTAGAGEDISKTGDAIERSADKHAP